MRLRRKLLRDDFSKIATTEDLRMCLVEQAYNPSCSGNYCRKITSSRSSTVKVKKPPKIEIQTSKQQKESDPPPPRQSSAMGGGRNSQGTRFNPQQREGQISENRLEIASYSTKH